MKLQRIIAYLVGCIVLAASFLAYIEYIDSLGFPDGFIAELEYAQRRLAWVFISVSIPASLWFIYLGAVASRKEISKQLLAAIASYSIFVVSIFLINYYYCFHLIDGAGG